MDIVENLVEKDYAVGLILDPKNRMLLQKKDEGYTWWPGYWCTFGGGIKNNEDPLTTFLREMKEENQLEFSKINLFFKQIFEEETKIGLRKKRRGNIFYFEASFDGNLSKLKLGEGGGAAIFTYNELVTYNDHNLIVPNNFEIIDKFYEEKVL